MIGFHRFDWEDCLTSIGYRIDETAQGHHHCRRSSAGHARVEAHKLNQAEVRTATQNTRNRRIANVWTTRVQGCCAKPNASETAKSDHVVYAVLASGWK